MAQGPEWVPHLLAFQEQSLRRNDPPETTPIYTPDQKSYKCYWHKGTPLYAQTGIHVHLVHHLSIPGRLGIYDIVGDRWQLNVITSPGRPPHNTTPPYHTEPPSPIRGHGTPQPGNTGTKPRHADSLTHPTGTTPGNPAHLTPAQRPPPATTRTTHRGNTTGQDSHQRAATRHNHANQRASPETGARSRTGRRTCPEHQHHTPTVP